jgi:hypothetical protein
VATLAPYFLAQPVGFADGMGPGLQNYLKRAKDGGVVPDMELLGPVVEVFSLPKPIQPE